MSLPMPGMGPLSEVVNSSTTVSRREANRLGIYETHNGNRDMNAVFGYPDTVTYDATFEMFKRHGIATRLTRGVAQSCWRDVPKITDSNDNEILVDEMAILTRRQMFRKLENADTLNRIGRFSVMFVGTHDNEDLTKPIGRVSSDTISKVFFQAYSEAGIEVIKHVDEASDERFGMPELYSLQIRTITDGKLQKNLQTRNVHWSRVVHLAEGALDNDVEGFSSLEPVYNFIIDLMKSEGGSSEAYWRNARRILAFIAKDGLGNATSDQLEQLRSDITEFTNGWRDAIRLGNVDVKQFEAQTSDPKETILGALKMISGATGIPLRILTGEGGGQTTGNEDKAAYNQLIFDRQEMVCTNWLLQTLQILANAGIIGDLPEGVKVEWPITESMNEKDKAEAADKFGSAIASVSAAFNPITGGLGGIDDPAQLIEDLTGIKVKMIDDDGFDDPVPPMPGME